MFLVRQFFHGIRHTSPHSLPTKLTIVLVNKLYVHTYTEYRLNIYNMLSLAYHESAVHFVLQKSVINGIKNHIAIFMILFIRPKIVYNIYVQLI